MRTDKTFSSLTALLLAITTSALAGYACSSGGSSLDGQAPPNGATTADGGAAWDDGGAPSTSVPVTPATISARRIRRLTRIEYGNTLRDLLGTTKDYGGSMPADSVVNGFADNADALEVDQLFADQARQNAEDIAAAFDLNTAGCQASAGESCARSFATAFGAKALRRPLTDDETTRYVALFTDVSTSAADKNAGLRAIVEAMLQSPSFLYRTELGAQAASGYALTPYEIASELSYLYWQSMPDDTLRGLAQSGDLTKPDVVLAQVDRLLASPRANGALDTFFEEWLELDRMSQAVKDMATYPTFTDGVRTDMRGEADAFFESVARDPNGTLTSLFTSTTSMLTPQLAQFYGVTLGTGPAVNGFTSTDMGPKRGGLLTLGGILAIEANPAAANPVRRGKLVRVHILCQDVPPPPPGVMFTAPPLDPTAPNRQKFKDHDTNPACSGCHQLMDPIGFGFEQFDGIGRLLAGTVDSTGAINGSVSSDTTFDGVRDLETKLAASADVQACFAKQWLRFGMGLTDTTSSDAEAKRLGGVLAAQGTKLQAVLRALPQAPYFFQRDNEVIPPP